MNGQLLHCALRPEKKENRCFFKSVQVGWLVSDFILKKDLLLKIIKDIKRGGHFVRILGRFTRKM
ncbi:TPA: hypothetical protein KDZ39_001152 [Vibrio parahaemolyticus]|uniref:hypothetical protein n=1 Tax=Vibrio parahaemolyticus TaxID=670 RepID=UPI001B83016D|nr:hypothetical protein [Vibrio parahaemolyticus]EHA6973994.1 hypothetical protein [Vibrio parahaemolyticus]EHR5319351.1 hypothetical protein [Vibrio parahaemolyticus]EJE4180828.1 hypothetical protein [Vibrio parahaemolyticus]ELZ7230452.1 hypothetical protein [Vibrio parahaemolyticus]